MSRLSAGTTGSRDRAISKLNEAFHGYLQVETTGSASGSGSFKFKFFNLEFMYRDYGV